MPQTSASNPTSTHNPAHRHIPNHGTDTINGDTTRQDNNIHHDDPDSDHDSDTCPSPHAHPTSSHHHPSTTSTPSYTQSEDLAVLHQLDLKLTSFLSLLYLLSFLDRSNIGNARVAGLESSLNLRPDQFDLCLTSFYVTYIAFEWMIMLYRVVPPHVYISACVFGWGVVASLQASVTGWWELVVLRALLGVTEASFGPGVPFYMTFFYRREELAWRVGLQICAAPLATAVAGVVAWVVLWGNERLGSGLEGWRALFLYEGAPSLVVAWVAWYWIPDGPGQARWLSPRLREVAVLRMQGEKGGGLDADKKGLRMVKRRHNGDGDNDVVAVSLTTSSMRRRAFLADIRGTLLDLKSWLTALMFLSVNVSFASLPVFLPTIISSMSFFSPSILTTQLLSSPPYLVAFVFVLFISRYSDRTLNSRGLCLCLTAGLSCLSYTVIAIVGLLDGKVGDKLSNILRYAAVYPAAMGLFSSVVLIITWTLNNQASSTGKGAGMVILNVVGQCGPLIGVRLFPKTQGPLYVMGMSVCAGFMGGVVVLSLGLRWWLGMLNTRSQEGKGEIGYEMVSSRADEEGDDDDCAVDTQPQTRFTYML